MKEEGGKVSSVQSSLAGEENEGAFNCGLLFLLLLLPDGSPFTIFSKLEV